MSGITPCSCFTVGTIEYRGDSYSLSPTFEIAQHDLTYPCRWGSGNIAGSSLTYSYAGHDGDPPDCDPATPVNRGPLVAFLGLNDLYLGSEFRIYAYDGSTMYYLLGADLSGEVPVDCQDTLVANDNGTCFAVAGNYIKPFYNGTATLVPLTG